MKKIVKIFELKNIELYETYRYNLVYDITNLKKRRFDESRLYGFQNTES